MTPPSRNRNQTGRSPAETSISEAAATPSPVPLSDGPASAPSPDPTAPTITADDYAASTANPAEPSDDPVADDLTDEPTGTILNQHQAVLHVHRNLAEELAVVLRPSESITPRVSLLRDVWVDMGSPSTVTVTIVPGDTLNSDAPE